MSTLTIALAASFIIHFIHPTALAQVVEESPLRVNQHLADLKEFGFEPHKDTELTAEQRKKAKAGLDAIFGGVGFRMYVPEHLWTKLMLDADYAREKNQTAEHRRQWVLFGNPPSPKSRLATQAGRESGRYNNGLDVGMSYSIRKQNDQRYANFTCFQCHAGMVAGRLVAGLGNAHIDQYRLHEELLVYKDVATYYRLTVPLLEIASFVKRDLIKSIQGLSDDDIRHLKNFSLYAETILSPVIKNARTRGDDYGPYPVWQLMARLQENPAETGFTLHPIDSEDRGLKQREALIQNIKFGPVDRKPWWLRKHDILSYVYGDTLATSEAGKDFAINFTVPHNDDDGDTNSTYPQRSREISSILDFAFHTKAPPFPKPFDKDRLELVETGHGIYENRCARCHGSFQNNASDTKHKWVLKYRSMRYAGKHPKWVGKTLPEVLYYSKNIDPMGIGVDPEWTEDTDQTYSRGLQIWGGTNPDTGAAQKLSLTGHAAGMRKYFAKRGVPEEKLLAVYNPTTPGYRAPPLVGIWASAPYLHNGSVPTLGDLFEYENFPRRDVWTRVYDTAEAESYDFYNIGIMAHDQTPFGWKPGAPLAIAKFRLVYNTKIPGYSNKGAVTCGPNLKGNKDQQDALLAFLTYLSDETVKPEGGPNKKIASGK